MPSVKWVQLWTVHQVSKNTVFKIKSIFFIVINNQYFRKSDVCSVEVHQWNCFSGIASVELLQWKCFSGSASRINEVQQVQVNGGISLKMASMVLKWLVIIVKTQAVISPPNNNNNSDDDNNISISFVNNKTPSSNSQHQQEQQRLRITSQLQ